MNRSLTSMGVLSAAAILSALGACTADSGCCGNCEEKQGTQVNASVMKDSQTQSTKACETEKKCSTECSEKPAEAAQPAGGGTSPEDINNLDRRERYEASVRFLSFENGRVSVRPQYAVAQDGAASAQAMTGFRDAWSMNHRDRATAYAAQAVRMDPQNADALFALGQALTQKGKTSEADAAYASALDIRPQWNEVRCELAMSYWRGDRMADAVAEFRRVVETDATNQLALERLAIASYYAGDKVAAWQYIDRATAAGQQVAPQLVTLLGERAK